VKLDIGHHDVVTSTDFETTKFSAGNLAVLFKILRKKMYSDPIYTICQEVMSNARDAHIEAGKAHVPILVKLPDDFESSIRIQDFGPGISPSRMAGVVCKYGESTKREANDESGGFGLGFKTPFAYVPTFTIIATTPEPGGEGVEYITRQYQAYIDKTGVGAISLLREYEGTAEEQGTSIIIPVMEKDYSRFSDCVLNAAFFWNVRPKVVDLRLAANAKVSFSTADKYKKPQDWRWIKIDWKFEGYGDRWKVLNTQNISYGGGRTRASGVIIDGIQYPLHLSKIYEDGTVPGYIRRIVEKSCLKLFFSVGDLEVTSNREDLDYNDDVRRKLKYLLYRAKAELLGSARERLSSANNIYEATSLFRKLKDDPAYPMVSNVWDGAALQEKISFGSSAEIYKYEYYGGGSVTRTGKYTSYSSQYNYNLNIPIRSDVMIIEDDLWQNRPSIPRIETIFELNPKLDSVYVVKFPKPETPGDKVEAHNNWEKARVKWDRFKVPLLSSFPKKRKSVTRAKSRISKVKLARGSGWDHTDISPESGSGLCVILKGKDIYSDWEKKKLVSRRNSIAIADFFNMDLYGVFSRWVPKMGSGWKNVRDFAFKKLEKMRKDPEIIIGLKQDPAWNPNEGLPTYLYNFLVKWRDDLDPMGVARSYLDAAVDDKTDGKIEELNNLEGLLGQPQSTREKNATLQNLHDKFWKAYTMIEKHHRAFGVKEEEIKFYIMAKDAHMAQEANIIPVNIVDAEGDD
tara:strand:- start:114712 stop:116937 length:2226 start_codon:yes stop_codon:yes gene_type:complete